MEGKRSRRKASFQFVGNALEGREILVSGLSNRIHPVSDLDQCLRNPELPTYSVSRENILSASTVIKIPLRSSM
jgi:hypothetical protein